MLVEIYLPTHSANFQYMYAHTYNWDMIYDIFLKYNCAALTKSSKYTVKLMHFLHSQESLKLAFLYLLKLVDFLGFFENPRKQIKDTYKGNHASVGNGV